MSAPILSTKLYIPPPRLKVVIRPRLFERLNEGLLSGHILTLISAPAGFGKTTLVSEWIARCRRPVAWLSLDEGDNDPSSFLSNLFASLQTIKHDLDKRILEAIQSSQSLTTINELLLINLVNEISAIPDNFILVLDDYHMIDSEPIDHALTYLLDHLPPNMHLVITTREDPSLPLPRYRARGQLTEMRATDLRFTPEEASAYLNQMMDLHLSVENITTLDVRTEGWIVGLQLAALSLQGREDIADFIQAFTGSHRFILDYLVEEVLHHQTSQIRSFLLQTAILDRFCAPLCNAITEREDGKEMLDVLDRSNLFLFPLDDKRQWYRYHHLFADVLQAHLVEAQPDLIATLHSRASSWFERNDLRSEAIRHALAAKEFEHAAGMIELAYPATEDKTIQPATWLGWVKMLPEKMLHNRPVLTVWYAYALLGIGDMEAAESRFIDAEMLLNGPMDKMVIVDYEQYKSLSAAIAVGHAYIAQAFGNIPDTVRYANRVLELPESNYRSHSRASMMLGMSYWASGDLEAASRVFADYTMKLRAAGNIPDAISSTVVLADIRQVLGHLKEAINTNEQLLQFVMEQAKPIFADTADLHRELSGLYLEQCNLDTARHHLQISKDLGEKAELPVWRYRWRIDHARIEVTQGDLDEALVLLDEAQRLYIRTPLPNYYQISAMKARIWIIQGRIDKALAWVEEQRLSADDDLRFLREFEHITLARILIAQFQNDHLDGSIQTAMRLLDRLLQAAEEGRRMGSVIEILVLQALAYQAQGNIASALTPLERAITLAEPEGYVRVFVDEGKSMADLLRRLDSKDRTPRMKQFILKLLNAIDLAKKIHPIGSGLPNPFANNNRILHKFQQLIEPLSERELEVLRLLRSDMNGPEIAHTLMISLSTMRTHTQNIYSKLGVNDRRAAVRRAEEFNLL